MKIVIWGVGTWGRKIFSRLKSGEVVAFIDNDPDKVGSNYKGIAIISLEQYIKEYSDYFILVSLLSPKDVICQLNARGIYNYFNAISCPVELWGPGEYADLDMYLESLNQGKKYGIFGTGFYAIYCYDRMRKRGAENLFLIQEFDGDERKKEQIRKAFDFVRFKSVDKSKNELDEILIATGVTKETQALKERVGSKVDIEDVFDLSRKIPMYQNSELMQFKNIHKGERCFIVATGPSLTMEDLNVIHRNKDYSISMNRIYLAFSQTCWRPNYYMVSDWRCIHEDEEKIRTISVPYKFVSDSYADFWKEKMTQGIYRYHNHSVYITGENPPFSDDLVYGTYGRATVTYECIQLAVYMGFKEIYLLGVDFTFSSNYKDKSNHFISTYYNKESQTAMFLEKESLEAYEAAKEYTEAHGIKIYNATRGGRLEVFERVDFDTLFYR